MKHFVGIDFGTTKTMAAVCRSDGADARTLRLGRGNDEMPTTMYKTDGGDLLFGDDADDEGITDLPNHATRFKMKLGKPGLAQAGRLAGSAVELAENFLAEVKKKLETQALHSPVKSVVLTVPAMFGPAQRRDLSDAAARAGFSQVELLHEPAAAAIAYCHRHPIREGRQRMLVVDWGGGTLDVALVDHIAGEEPVIRREFIQGRDDVGGEVFDDDLWNIANGALLAAGDAPLDSQPREQRGRYRRDLSKAKERLSFQQNVKMRFTLKGGERREVELTRGDFEQIIAPRVGIAAELVRGLCDRAKERGQAPDFILLAGGTSRIPMIKQALESATGIPCRSWLEGREAIALGAAIHARNLWDTTGSDNVPRPSPRPEDESSIAKDKKIEALTAYRELLMMAFADHAISKSESDLLRQKRDALGLSPAEALSMESQILGASLDEVFNRNIRLCPNCGKSLGAGATRCWNKSCLGVTWKGNASSTAQVSAPRPPDPAAPNVVTSSDPSAGEWFAIAGVVVGILALIIFVVIPLVLAFPWVVIPAAIGGWKFFGSKK